ncbi:toxin HicA [Pandoraea pulmonicola]|uniref:toxin HicA n=1 Tax=Pandoraea pulmonicola TaxID=93221 RepID=UPI0009340404|nr:toxin HicA [Pandoraea pulmonicola]
MPSSAKLLAKIAREPTNVRFDELLALCKAYFGEPRRAGSHTVFKTPWYGDPRVNLQRSGGMAKVYQVRQVLNAIRKIEDLDREH